MLYSVRIRWFALLLAITTLFISVFSQEGRTQIREKSSWFCPVSTPATGTIYLPCDAKPYVESSEPAILLRTDPSTCQPPEQKRISNACKPILYVAPDVVSGNLKEDIMLIVNEFNSMTAYEYHRKAVRFEEYYSQTQPATHSQPLWCSLSPVFALRCGLLGP